MIVEHTHRVVRERPNYLVIVIMGLLVAVQDELVGRAAPSNPQLLHWIMILAASIKSLPPN